MINNDKKLSIMINNNKLVMLLYTAVQYLLILHSFLFPHYLQNVLGVTRKSWDITTYEIESDTPFSIYSSFSVFNL